ncbi:GntR family transcriptional regulator [Streptomyces sp. NPDC018833]|uniref:GntR family transcriptional regulator n=1 Tax=Streptomyces sp. NPDC018833 TaxID=3365053 RepID=UPI0037BD1F58
MRPTSRLGGRVVQSASHLDGVRIASSRERPLHVRQADQPSLNSELPVYVQIKNRLRWEILTGAYPEGGQLPSACELGSLYGANKNTILRALRMLRSEGMIDFGRGRGAVVTHSVQPVDLAAISEQLQTVVNVADASGIPRSALISVMQRIPRVMSARAAGSKGLRTAPRGPGD